MTPKVIAPPVDVITSAELYAHLNLDPIDGVYPQAGLVASYLAAAHAYAEHYTGLSIGEQTLEIALDAFPPGSIELPQGPVTSITSITYLDQNGDVQTVDGAAYILDDYSTPDWAVPAINTSWPMALQATNAVKVRYEAGSSTVPAAAHAAMLLHVGHQYANREAVTVGNVATEVPLGVKALLDTLRTYR